MDIQGSKHYLETGEELPPLSFEWCMEVLRQEVVDSVNLLDERRGILHVRRHLAASPLFKGIPNFRNTRIAMLRAETKEELFQIFDEITSQRKENPEILNQHLFISILQELVLVPEE